MRAYRRFRKNSSLKYVVYLTEEERSNLLEEGDGVDSDYTPHWSKFLSHLKTPREDGK